MRTVSRLSWIVGRSLVVFACSAAAATPAFARQVEASVEGGYTASEGISASQDRIILGSVYRDLDITSGASFGITAGAYIGPNFELEFLWSRQFSHLEASNPAPSLQIAKMNVDNYHGNMVYNFGEPDTAMRPFVFFGLGATHLAPGDFEGAFVNPGPGLVLTRLDSKTKFSSTWGGGIKYYMSPRVGVKGTLRWTPTYIKTDPGGYWCDPFYPTCWVIGDPDYAQQLTFSGGVTFRFGGGR